MKPGLLLIIFLPLAAWGVLRDIVNTANGGSIDLRNRVTGARIAAAKLDPYSYKWMGGEPEEFCDIYNEPGGLLSKTTVTPWVLAAHAPFNSLNYRTTQWLWFFFQYGALVAGVVAWLRCHPGAESKWGIALVLMFCVTPSWRHHVDHGQIYVVFAAMFLLLFRLSRIELSKPLSIVEGLLGAFTLGSRPIFLGQFAEPVRARRWLSLGGAGFGLILVLVVPILLFGPVIWTHYRNAMEVHSEIYLLQLRPGRVPVPYPGIIEGIPLDVLAGFSRKIPFADTSIFRILSFQLPPRILLVSWVILMGASLLFMIRKGAPTNLIWWAAAAWIVVGDFLLPAFRHPYNDVLALPMILFGISAFVDGRDQRIWIFASGFVLLLMMATWWIPTSAKWFFPLPSLALGCLALAALVWTILLARKIKGKII